MPPAPPARPAPGVYHFHTYDYPPPTAPYVASPMVNGFQFYSMLQDLQALQAWGAANGVPNCTFGPAAVPGLAPTVPGVNQTLVLSMGPAVGVVGAPSVVFTGGVHAREWIATEFAYLLAEYLVRNYVLAPPSRYRTTLRALVNSRRIVIAPMLNPDGNVFSVFTPAAAGRLWRKNRRGLPGAPAGWVNELTNFGAIPLPNPPPFANVNGAGALCAYDVPDYDPGHGIPPGGPAAHTPRTLANGQTGVDLNRNYGTTAWAYDTDIPTPLGAIQLGWDPTFDLYFGPRAGSEPESANVQVILANAAAGGGGIATTIDYHSYAKAILYPSEAYNTGQVGPDYKQLGKSLRQLVHTQGGGLDYQLGSSNQVIHYEATGSQPDRAAQQHQARAFTIELDPAYGTLNGFLLGENMIQPVFEKNIRGVLAALAAPQHPANIHLARLQRVPIIASTLKFLTWNVYGHGNQLP
jgi:hypothetical protein